MSCSNFEPGVSSLEYQRRRKPENNNGCACGRAENTCDTPSLALEGSPLYLWEQKYGKLVTTVTVELDENGRKIQVVEKKPCPPPPDKRNYTCCSLGYKIIR
jgi:hypothetical protein